MSIRKEDTHISECSTANVANNNNNSESNVLKLINLAIALLEKKINLEEDETFFQLFKETDVVHEFESNNHLIHYAAFYNHEPLLKLIIKHYPEALTSRNKNGMVALHCTTNYNSIKILVEAGCPINAMNDNGVTPLMYALMNGKQRNTILYLLRNKANPTIPLPYYDMPIKSLTDDKFIIECIEEYEIKWIKDHKKENLSD